MISTQAAHIGIAKRRVEVVKGFECLFFLLGESSSVVLFDT